MGMRVNIKEVKGVTTYRIWNDDSQRWVTDWISEQEALKFFFWRKFTQFMHDFVEDGMTFPNGYYDKDSKRHWISEKGNKHQDYMLDILKGDDYQSVLSDKFTEILSEMGMEISINEIKTNK